MGLWRTDLAAFDCLAHGGLFAAIGAGGSLRHAPPCDEQPQSSGGAHPPSVLLPDLMRFSKADFLAERYANDRPPRCECSMCEGSPLDSFNSLRGEVRAAAHAHNAATWNSWLPDLFAHSNLGDRQEWWKTVAGQRSTPMALRTSGSANPKRSPPQTTDSLGETAIDPHTQLYTRRPRRGTSAWLTCP
jgi:hypothetical protein